MFDQTFVDGVGKTNKSWTVALTFLFQVAGIGVMILIPLIWTDVLPKAQLASFLVAPAPPPPPPPPPPPAAVVKAVKIAPRQYDTSRLTAPKEIPKQVAMITEDPAAFSLSQSAVGGVPGGVPGGIIGGASIGIGAAPPPPPPPPPPPAPKAPPKDTGPKPIGGKIAEANRIKTVQPNYPPLAKQARIQGDVKFTAIIAKDGTIQKLELVSGNPLLVPAAREAVVQWLYKPTILNGEPVDVITDITVHFTLQ